MRIKHLPKCFLSGLCLSVWFCIWMLMPAYAYESSTLYNGCRGEDVRELQQALIDLGFLKGGADGIFGNKTENAVRSFQKKNNLSVDGLAGEKTRNLAISKAAGKTKTSSQSSAQASAQTAASSSVSSGSLFGGDYTTIRIGEKGPRVKTLQQSLITTGFLRGSADGIFGNQTQNAVIAFQSSCNLAADGLAGKKTLTALEKAVASGTTAPAATVAPVQSVSAPAAVSTSAPSATSAPVVTEINDRISAPSVSSLQLLHWFNDIKPAISGGQQLLIYDPASGLSWTLRVMSRGRHCDAEPLTAADTNTMVQAFGGENTWNQKGVYVMLPDGRWTIGSTHDMPHDSSSIKNNGFNGHLCVHFLRDMSEARENDPKYGVANQETIRRLWKNLTGQDITT